ncbi:hypothetical protein [Microcella pacifica]|uniref:Uncharacterized protein n=1 Tax=Microcella pacifica TaxID=2591847 RepID=A0A9E5JPN5_9MICO|nr:hypothetical protein [Microcella pacifica]NHF63300.1 hypothetical protein [Microcella pacifica]
MRVQTDRAINTAEYLKNAGVGYLVFSLIAAALLVFGAFNSISAGQAGYFVGAAVGVALSGWLVQAFASAVAAHINVAATVAYANWRRATSTGQ